MSLTVPPCFFAINLRYQEGSVADEDRIGLIKRHADGLNETWTRIDVPARSLVVSGDRLVTGSERDGAWLADLPSRNRRVSGRVGP